MIRGEVRRLLGEGKTDDEIKLELGLADNELLNHRTTVVEEERNKTGRPPVEVFVEYQLRQLKHIDDLEEVRAKAQESGQLGHAVSATKAKAELLDKIIQRGQELGVYHREGQKLTIKGAMGLVHMSPRQLAEHLDHSFQRLQALSEDLGRPLELGEISKPSNLRLVKPAGNEDVQGVIEVTESVGTTTGGPEVAAPVVSEVPVKVPTKKRARTVQTGGPHGSGDPGPDRPLAERVYEAAMRPKPGSGRRPEGEIAGDPAGLRARVFAGCPQCSKRLLGVNGLARHIHFLHQVPEDEATMLAQKAVESERMSMAREYAAHQEAAE